jgi:hypothetical protein
MVELLEMEPMAAERVLELFRREVEGPLVLRPLRQEPAGQGCRGSRQE